MVRLTKLFVSACFATLVVADLASTHPSAHHASKSHQQLAARKLFVNNGKRLLEQSSKSEQGRKLLDKAAARRASMLENIQAER